MRILVLSNNDLGLLKFRRELLEQLCEQHHEVICCCPTERLEEAIKDLGCSVIPCSLLKRHGINAFDELKLIRSRYSTEINKLIKQIRN